MIDDDAGIAKFDPREDREALRQLEAETPRRQIKIREPQRMANVLSQLLARRGYAQQQSLADQEDAWKNAVGEELARLTRPGLVRRGVWEVFVSNSTLLQELTFRKRELVAKVTASLPNHKIRDLKFRVGPVK